MHDLLFTDLVNIPTRSAKVLLTPALGSAKHPLPGDPWSPVARLNERSRPI